VSPATDNGITQEWLASPAGAGRPVPVANVKLRMPYFGLVQHGRQDLASRHWAGPPRQRSSTNDAF
jgi:hypothetical protein